MHGFHTNAVCSVERPIAYVNAATDLDNIPSTGVNPWRERMLEHAPWAEGVFTRTWTVGYQGEVNLPTTSSHLLLRCGQLRWQPLIMRPCTNGQMLYNLLSPLTSEFAERLVVATQALGIVAQETKRKLQSIGQLDQILEQGVSGALTDAFDEVWEREPTKGILRYVCLPEMFAVIFSVFAVHSSYCVQALASINTATAAHSASSPPCHTTRVEHYPDTGLRKRVFSNAALNKILQLHPEESRARFLNHDMLPMGGGGKAPP